MLGFPTETREEIQATIDFAVNSDLAQAYFFNVVPQPGTPLYDLALAENADALRAQTLLEYGTKTAWYTAAYGVNMEAIIKRAYLTSFRTQPATLGAADSVMPWKNFVMEFSSFIAFFRRRRVEDEPLPEELSATFTSLRC